MARNLQQKLGIDYAERVVGKDFGGIEFNRIAVTGGNQLHFWVSGRQQVQSTYNLAKNDFTESMVSYSWDYIPI